MSNKYCIPETLIGCSVQIVAWNQIKLAMSCKSF